MLWHSLDGNYSPEMAHLVDSKAIYWAGRQPDAKEGVVSFLEKRKPNFTMSIEKDLPDFYPWWNEISTRSML